MISGYTRVIIAVIIWSIMAALLKLIDLSGFEILLAASLIGLIIVFSKVLLEKRFRELKPKGNRILLLLIAIGVFHLFNNGLYFSAVRTTTLSNAVLTHYLAPILIPIFAFSIKEKVKRISVIAAIVSFIGLIIILLPNELVLSNVHFLGMLLGTGSALFFAFQVLGARKLTESHSGDIIVVWKLLVTFILLLPFVSLVNFIGLSIVSLTALIIFGIFMGISFILYFGGLKEVKAQHAGILAYIEPLGAIVWAALFFAEIPHIFTLIGGALIILGGYMVIKYRSP